MRRALRLLWTLTLAALAVPPAAHATSVTVQLIGEWFQVTDNANVTGGSIAVGVPFTVTLTFDDATPDSNGGDPTLGDYVFLGATSSLMIHTGGFTFTLGAAENIIFSVGNGFIGQDDFTWFAQNFTTSGPLPIGITTGASNSSASVVDSSATAHTSDDLTGLPWLVSAYDSPNQGMYFLTQVLGAGPNKRIELFGEFTGFQVLPEPSALLLAILAVVPLLRRQRRV
jgi:hypothetical protein